jgi:predicted acylesterase/phospholipase RssA
LGEDLTKPYSFAWNNVAAGSFSITAKATNSLNATSTSTAVSIIVSSATSAPVVTITSPTTGSTFLVGTSVAFAVTATDLKSGSEVVLSSGRLVDALLDTIAMPGIFPACHIGDLELVDGGTLDPVPVAPARALVPRLPVVAVSLTLPIGSAARTWSVPLPVYVPRVLIDRLNRMRYGLMLDVVLRSMDITNRAVTDYRLEVDKPDVIIRPQVGNIDVLDIINIREVIKIGEQAVDEVLPLLKQKFTLRKRIRRALGARV